MEITIPPTSHLKNSSLFHAPSEGCPPEQRIVQSGQRLPCGAVGQAGLRQLKDLLRPPDSDLRIAVVFAGERHGGNPVVMRRNFAQHELEHIHTEGLFAPGFSTVSLSGGKNAVCMGSASAAMSAAYEA